MPTGGRQHFDQQLQHLNELVLEMGARSGDAVARAMRALVHGDPDLAHEVIAGDAGINDLRTRIEGECYRLLATEQPVARDMRSIVSALIVATDLERIGDHAKKVAATYLRMMDDPRPIPLTDIQRLGDIAHRMLDQALSAYASSDTALAEATCRMDDSADGLYRQIFNVTLSYMLEDPRAVGAGTHLLQVAHELERVADRSTNVAERVIFTSTGNLLDLNV